MITGFAGALLSLVFAGAFIMHGYEGKVPELGFTTVRNIVPFSHQLGPNANWLAIEELSNEDSLEYLENAYYYKMNEDEVHPH